MPEDDVPDYRAGFEPVLLGTFVLCRGCWSVTVRWALRRHAQRHVDRGDPWPPPGPPGQARAYQPLEAS